MQHFISQTIEILKSKTIQSISIMLSANATSVLIGFFITIIALNGLSDSAIGILFPLVSITLMVKQFSDFGLNRTFIIKASDKSRGFSYKYALHNNYFWLKVIIGVLVSIIGILLSSPISQVLFSTNDHQIWVAISFALLFFQIISMYFLATLQVQNAFKQLSLTKILPQLIKLIGLASLLYTSTLNFENAFIFYMAIGPLVLLLSINRKNILPIKSTIKLNHSKELIRVGKWIWISMIASAGIAHFDILMVRSIAGDTELARLVAGQRLASVILILSTSLSLVLLPKVSSTTTIKELQYFVRKVLTYLPLLFVFTLIIIPFTPFITLLLLGERYYEAAGIFNIYLVANTLAFILSPLGLVLYKLKQERAIALIALAQFLFNIIGNYYFIPLYGATASASITLACKILAALFMFPLLYRYDIFKK